MTEDELDAVVRKLIDDDLRDLLKEAKYALRMGDAYLYVTPRRLLNLFVRAGYIKTEGEEMAER